MYVSSHKLISIINRCHLGLSLGDVGIVIGVVGDEQHFWKINKIHIHIFIYTCQQIIKAHMPYTCLTFNPFLLINTYAIIGVIAEDMWGKTLFFGAAWKGLTMNIMDKTAKATKMMCYISNIALCNVGRTIHPPSNSGFFWDRIW